MKTACGLMILLGACAAEPGNVTYVAHATGNGTCAVVELDNTAPAQIGTLRATFAGGDHLEVSRGGSCAEYAAPWLVATTAQPELVLPQGIAFPIEAHERFVVRGDDGVDFASVTIEAVAVADPGTLARATVMTAALPPVALAPNAAKVVEGALPMPPGMQLFAFVGRTHRYGTGVHIAISVDAITDRVPLYLPNVFRPSAPPTQSGGPLEMPEGGELYVRCTYYNTSVAPVGDELCGFWAYVAYDDARDGESPE